MLRRRFEEGYAELAALGQSAAGLSRTIAPILDEIRSEAQTLRDTFNGTRQGAVRRALAGLEMSVANIGTMLSMVSHVDGDSRDRRRVIDLVAELQNARRMILPLLAERGVVMEVVTPGAGLLRTAMRPETFHRLLHILASNSLDWLAGVKGAMIRITARTEAERCILLFSDNGPGISPALAGRIFEPLYSGKEGGHGMGLTIARSIVELHGGEIGVVSDRRRRGATIRIALSRKRPRATVAQD
jgi:signal transduction histidine kinase